MANISIPAHLRRSRSTLMSRMARRVGLWRQRRALARLDDAALDDIGVTRREADAEARRPVWDAPASWRL